jgi:hypothetical protein
MTRILFPLLLLLSSGSTLADEYMRCGSHLVSRSDPLEEFIKKCGEPTSKDIQVQDIRAPSAAGGRHTVGQTTVEVWTYDRGPQKFPMIVTVVDGKVKKIETGRR